MPTREVPRRTRRRHRRNYWPSILLFLILLLICTVFFAAGYNTGLAAAQDTEPITVKAEAPAEATTAQEANPVSTPAPTVTPEAEEPVRYRDDIVSDGNLLSYELQEIMQDCCDEYGVPYALALAVAEAETHFDPDAVSTTNDYGLMQINQSNHGWLQEMGFDPLTYAGNIEAGIYIISQQLQKYGEPELALMAYNCGPTGARKLWDAGAYQTDYTRKVMTAYEYWTSLLEG